MPVQLSSKPVCVSNFNTAEMPEIVVAYWHRAIFIYSFILTNVDLNMNSTEKRGQTTQDK